ncbi:hypothetical protein [Nitrogeniibacter aestuarii]|uniref:hypothetical protein n=1 Tax=Nitrogeniibacter aestuarii TaxID=2815343 RepID=UPI001E2B305E|nr:hypothetical protein [Nitrogeniibacter aestuarii]
MATAELSFEQAPPLSVPLRFFYGAPIFLFLAALLMMFRFDQVFVSRWTPQTLALTHLVTAGFMLQVMLGALFQLMPVAAGANLWRPHWLVWPVHVGSFAGALGLAWGFYASHGAWLAAGGVLLTLAVLVFMLASALALLRTPARGPTVSALRLAVLWLGVTVAIGLSMAAARGGYLGLEPLQWSQLHVAGGLVGWGGLLVAATAYLVVPMFQLTPAYPAWFSRAFAWALAGALVLGAAATHPLAWIPAVVMVMGFAVMTLDRQRRRRRAKTDLTLSLWRQAMSCVLLGGGLSLLVLLGENDPRISVAAGVLVLYGAFVSLIAGMLYKIVPFILWLFLQPRLSQVPPMTRMLNQPLMRWHWWVHSGGLVMAGLAAFWSPMGLGAGVAIGAASLLLLAQLMRVGRHAQRALATLSQPS